jgi:hypothetical protein
MLGFTSPAERDLAAFYGRNASYGSTERYRSATLAEAYYYGLQYEGRDLVEWDAKGVPLRKRKPRLIEPLFAKAVNALNSFTWGGHRFPRASVTATRTEDDTEDAREIGPRLDHDQAAALTKFLCAVVREGKLERVAREASRKALLNRSVAIILGARGGYITAHVEPGKHCTPTFDPDNPRHVASLEIVYQHQREEPTASGAVRKRWYWYRRVIDAQRDVVFREVPVIPGRAPEWVEDPEKTVEHRLGFCPVDWWRTMPDCADAIDGQAVIDPQVYPLLDAVNYTLSQRDKAVNYGCNPQPIRTGVDEADRDALNKAPENIWDLPQGADFKFAEIAGPGVQRATEHVQDLARRFLEAVRVVLMDPQALTGDISGRVLELIHTQMIALASDLRAELGDEGYCGLLALALRLVATLVQRGEDVWIPGARAAGKLLVESQLAGPWLDPPIALAWPAWFAPSAQEQQTRVQSVLSAVGKLITDRTAVREVAEVFHVEDPDAEYEALEGAEDESQEPKGDAPETAADDAPKPQGDEAKPDAPKAPEPPAPEAKSESDAPEVTITDDAEEPAAKPEQDPAPKPPQLPAASADIQINAFDYDGGVITVNEVRRLKFGLPPIDGGDVPVAQWRQKFATPAGDAPGAEPATDPSKPTT